MILWLNSATTLLWAWVKFLGTVFLVITLASLIFAVISTVFSTIDESKRWK